VCDIQPTEQQEKNISSQQQTGCPNYQEIIEQITQLRETVILLESRLSNQNHINEGQDMRHILARFKGILRQLETINPYQYDGLVMQCLGSF
jgi:hypothetical protein